MWRDRHFQEIGESRDAHLGQKKAADDNQPISIPGIDDSHVPAVRKLQSSMLPRGTMAHQLQFADNPRSKRSRFDLSLTGESSSIGGLRSMESEMVNQDVDDAIMGSSMTPLRSRFRHGPGRQAPINRHTRPRFTSSIRIPRHPIHVPTTQPSHAPYQQTDM